MVLQQTGSNTQMTCSRVGVPCRTLAARYSLVGGKAHTGEVAGLLSRPQSFVSKSESGERRVNFVELTHFAKIYRKPLGFFEIT